MSKRAARRSRAYQRQPAPVVANDTAPKPMKVSPEFVAHAHAGRAKPGQGVTAERLFAPYQPAKGVLPSGGKIAMDEFPALPWAAGGYPAGALYSEGLVFPGYPELSLLAQRPEYRLISETIALEATRKWIVFKNNGEADKDAKIDTIEREFDRLDVRGKFREISEHDGFFGRSHLYPDFGYDDEDAQELRTPIGNGKDDASKEKIAGRRLIALNVIEPSWIYPATYNTTNPLKSDWYKPRSWYVMGREIHASRLLTFIGREVPDILKPAYAFGGLSMSQMAKPYIENWLQTRQGVNDIIQSFSTFVLSTNMQAILSGETAGVSNFYARLDAFNLNRDNRGIMAIDKELEAFQNVSAPLGSLDHLQAQAQEHMAAVSKIPLVKLTGISPSGLNASSEGELQVWDDNVHAYQENFFGPNLRKIFNFVQMTLWGEIDPELDFEFEHLRELSEKEQAEIASTTTAAIVAAHQDQIIDTPTAMQELKKASDITGLFASIQDEDIEEAKLAPPMPGEMGMGGPGMPPAPGMENGNVAGAGQSAAGGAGNGAGEPNGVTPEPLDGTSVKPVQQNPFAANAHDEDVWITTKGKGDGPGSHVKIDAETGKIKAGFGGKFDGKKISDVGNGGAAGQKDKATTTPASGGKSAERFKDYRSHSGSEVELEASCGKLRSQSLKSQPTAEEAKMLTDYTGVSYSWTNAGLRSGDPEMEDEPQVKALTDYINKASLAEDTVLYRGFSAEIVKKTPDFLKPGSVIRDRAFVSTSIDREIASGRNDNGAGLFVMHIYAKKGAKALPIDGASVFSDENEVLIQRGSQYKIVSVDEKTKTIHAELL